MIVLKLQQYRYSTLLDENEWIDAGRDGRTDLARPDFWHEQRFQLTTSRIDNIPVDAESAELSVSYI